MSKALSPIQQVIKAHRRGEAAGLYSVCCSHPIVLTAAMRVAQDYGTLLLVEATSNQVDQYGGYTGMNPARFRAYVEQLARERGFPLDRLVLGGDHLGPNGWQGRPAFCFGQGEALAVVADRHGPLQRLFQCRDDQAAVQRRHVGAELAAADGIDHAGQADAHRRRGAQRGVGALHDAGDGLDEQLEIVAGRGDALAVDFIHPRVEGDQLDLAAADIDAVDAGQVRMRHGGRWSRP